jgi:hypothetical protein
MTVKYHKFKFDKCNIHTWLIDGCEMIRLTRYLEEKDSGYEWELEFPKIEMYFNEEKLIKYAGDIKVIMKSVHTIIGMK